MRTAQEIAQRLKEINDELKVLYGDLHCVGVDNGVDYQDSRLRTLDAVILLSHVVHDLQNVRKVL